MPTTTRDIHDLIDKPNNEKEQPVTFKIKKSRETARLFTGSFRSVLLVTAYDYFRVTRVNCLTKNSSYVYLPIDYPEQVTFTNIDNKRCRLSRSSFKSGKKLWLTVIRKFTYNKITYDVGDILTVKKSSLWRRFTRWINQQEDHENNNSTTSSNVECFLYPGKKPARLPVQLLELHGKLCEPPGTVTGIYRYLSTAIEEEILPFLITIPFDPFKRTIAHLPCDDASNVGNVGTPTSTTSNSCYLENVLVESTTNFDVFIVSNTKDNRLTALVVPTDVTFSVEELPTRSTTTTHTIRKITTDEISSLKQSIIPQIINTEIVEQATEITIRNLDNDDLEQNVWGVSTQNSTCHLNPKDHPSIRKKKKSKKKKPNGLEDDPPLLQYSFESSFLEPSDGGTSESDLSEGEFHTVMKGGMNKREKKNEYLLPLNKSKKADSSYKLGENNNNNNNAETSDEHSNRTQEIPEMVVVGPDGYVEVNLENGKHKERKGLIPRTGQQLEKGFNIYKEKPPLPNKNKTFTKDNSLKKPRTIPDTTTKDNIPPPSEKVVLRYSQKSDGRESPKDNNINNIRKSNSEKAVFPPTTLSKEEDASWSNTIKALNNKQSTNLQGASSKPSQPNYSSNSFIKPAVTTPKKPTKSPRNFIHKFNKTTQPRPVSQSFTPLISSQCGDEMDSLDGPQHHAMQDFYITKTQNSLKSRITFFEHNTP